MPRFLTYLSEHLLLSRHRTASRPGGRGTTAPAPRVFDLAELEDRILISAAPVPLEVTAGKVEAPESANSSGDGTAGRLTLVAAPTSDTHTQTKAQPAAAPTAAEEARDTQLQRDLVVLDANAANIQQMLADLLSQEDPNQPLDVALLDAPHEMVDFDAVSGQLTIHGDARDNAVHQSFTADGLLTITLDGVTRSAQPLSPFYDPALAGASSTTLRSIVMSGSGGQDSLTLGDQSLDGSLTIQTDGDLVVAGSIRVAERFLAEAATIELVGSIVAPSGHVTLHSTWATLVTGLLDVSALPDGMGGRAELLGPCVAVLDSATIDASGDLGGGVVLVGGDYQGHNPAVENAQHTWVGTGSQIRADAEREGPGGQIIVWADATTQFYGSITARGGASGGDGGLVEVSGKEHLRFHGTVDVSAEHGTFGTLLLDPTDIIIANGTADSAADGTNTFRGTPSNIIGSIVSTDTGPTTIYESELEGLGAGANIILQATNNVTINDLTDNTLSLAATGGSLTIRADFDGDGIGSFSMNTGDTIRTQGGAVNIRGASLSAVGAINTSGAAAVAGGAVTLTADVGTMSVSGAVTTTGGSNANGGSVNMTAGGVLTVGGMITTSGGTYLAGNPGRNAGSVTLTGSTVSAAAITAAGTSATSGVAAGGAGGAVLLDATAGGMTLGGSVTTTGGNGFGGGAGGNAGAITVSDAATLTANVILSAVGGTGGTTGVGGPIQLLGTVDGNVAATRCAHAHGRDR